MVRSITTNFTSGPIYCELIQALEAALKDGNPSVVDMKKCRNSAVTI